ncbi:MAG: hypothetical protein JRJ76_08835, partial [Deltaproteobacteria bacterium]|nr:hypothetical protein [Deltaproteobacteria bacterium]
KSTDKKTLIFVMGIQRSGGSTLLNAFKRNRNISILREKDNKIFDYFMLRPEREIRPSLDKSKRIAFIEAKSETKKREVVDILSEFSHYTVKIIWNYRNPVNVYYSRLIKYPHKDWVADEVQFSEMWNQRNASVLKAMDQYRDDIAIVKLEDLAVSKKVFKQLCDFIGVKGRNTFYADKINTEKELSDTIIKNINNHTSPILKQLDLNRRFSPDH